MLQMVRARQRRTTGVKQVAQKVTGEGKGGTTPGEKGGSRGAGTRRWPTQWINGECKTKECPCTHTEPEAAEETESDSVLPARVTSPSVSPSAKAEKPRIRWNVGTCLLCNKRRYLHARSAAPALAPGDERAKKAPSEALGVGATAPSRPGGSPTLPTRGLERRLPSPFLAHASSTCAFCPELGGGLSRGALL